MLRARAVGLEETLGGACDLGTSAFSPVKWKQRPCLVGLWVPLQCTWRAIFPGKVSCCSVLSTLNERIWTVPSVPGDGKSTHLIGCCSDNREL